MGGFVELLSLTKVAQQMWPKSYISIHKIGDT